MKNLIYSVLFLLLSAACGNTRQPIAYGEDNCQYCQMRIMDPRFGAEAITEKGRCFKFDSGECLLRYLNESKAQHRELLVTDYDNPESLIDAQEAFFLVSEAMPSPMGGNLNAFAIKDIAIELQTKNGGEIFEWNGIKAKYEK